MPICQLCKIITFMPIHSWLSDVGTLISQKYPAINPSITLGQLVQSSIKIRIHSLSQPYLISIILKAHLFHGIELLGIL